MILIDILLALTLASIFVAIVAESSLGARDIYYRAHDREAILEALLAHESSFEGLLPYEHRADPFSSTSASAVWYGNDRIETDMEAVATGSPLSAQSVDLQEIRAYPYADLSDPAGTPLCSVDFLHRHKPNDAVIIPIQLPIPQSIPLTDLEARDGIAYISTDSATASDPDLFIFDIHDPNAPKLLSSINTGPGISAIAIAGKRIYAAADSTAAQLHVIRLDSLASPVLETKFKLPLPYATATAPFASSIFYDKSKIYLGTEKWDGDEFNVIDVSDPTKPMKMGGFGTGTKINGTYVRNGIAYIADSDQDQLRLVDVQNPAAPMLSNSFSPSGWQRQEGQTLNFFEDSLSFGRTSGGFDIPTDLEGFGWSTTSIASLMNPFGINDPGGVYGIIADRTHLFSSSRQVGKEFQIFDRSLIASTTFPLPASVQAMTCDNDSIYILGHVLPVIYQITFT